MLLLGTNSRKHAVCTALVFDQVFWLVCMKFVHLWVCVRQQLGEMLSDVNGTQESLE